MAAEHDGGPADDSELPPYVGSFTIQERSGGDARAASYRAVDPAGLAVTVTVVRRQVADELSFRARMHAEIEAVRRAGPTVAVPLLDADAWTSEPWIAVRAGLGQTLEAVVSSGGPLPEERVWHLAATLVGAVTALRSAGATRLAPGPEDVVLTLDGPRLTGLGVPGSETDAAAAPEDDAVVIGGILLFAASGRLPSGGVPSDLPQGLRQLLTRCLTRTTTPQEIETEARARLGGTLPSQATVTLFPPAGTPAGMPAPPGYPPSAATQAWPHPYTAPKAPWSTRRTIVAVAVALVLIAGAAVGTVLATRGGGGGRTVSASGSPKPSGSGSPASQLPGGPWSTQPSGPMVVVSAFSHDLESQTFADIYILLLKHAGVNVLGRPMLIPNIQTMTQAMRAGGVDVMPDFTSLIATQLNIDRTSTDAQLASAARTQGLRVGESAPADDAEAFAISNVYAQAHNLTTLSDLAASGLKPRIAADPDCPQRPGCLPALQQYGITGTVLPGNYATSDAYNMVLAGNADLADTSLTTPLPPGGTMVMLTDDKHVVAPDHPVPLASDRHADVILPVLNRFSEVLTQLQLQQLAVQTSQAGANPQAIAQTFVSSLGLV